MTKLMLALMGGLTTILATAADLRITSLGRAGDLTVSNTIPNGVLTVEKAASPQGPWLAGKSIFTLGSTAAVQVPLAPGAGFYRTLAVDVSGATNSWVFAPSEIINLDVVAAQLFAASDPVSEDLYFRFSQATLDLLQSYQGGPSPDLQKALTDEFNTIVQGGAWYDEAIFAAVHLSPSTRDLIARSPTGPELMRLNRQLLEDAYPESLFQKRTAGFLNLASAYGLLTTIAGSGNIVCSACNSWRPEFEGDPATAAALSSPHIAMADRAGNIYIADKRANAIRKVSPDGTIHTVAGTGSTSPFTTEPAPATSVGLNNPNGIFVLENGVFYILDRDIGLIRRVDTNGIMTTIVNNVGAIPGGRGLWVSPDESWLVFSAKSQLKKWDNENGLTVLADGFSDLGNVAMDPGGRLVVTDAGFNQVTRLETNGTKTVIAGNGAFSGGGDGRLALDTGLWQVRGIWFLPTGAYFLTTDGGSQVWYVDLDAHIHLFMDGDAGGAHSGDGGWFYDNPHDHKVSFAKEITIDYDGNLLITESDRGYVRKVNFSRLNP